MEGSAKRRLDAPDSWSDFFDAKLSALRDAGEYRVFRTLERTWSEQDSWSTHYRDRQVSNFCSNDYLAMSMHPEVVQTALEAVRTHGVGAGGSRNIGGTYAAHLRLERALAELHGYDAGLIFTSGYLANYVPLQTIGTRVPNVVFYSDEMNHASMIDAIGVATRDSKLNCDKRIFRHNDLVHLERLLASDPPDRPKVIVFESLYSMEADIAPIAQICELGHRYGALVFLNEVHAVGVYGPRGSGLLAERAPQAHKPHIIVGTLGKAFGAIGGYMVGDAETVDFVRSFGRGFIFTTSLPPAIAAAATAAVQHLKHSDEERNTLQRNVARLKQGLRGARIPFIGDSHIVPVMVGDSRRSVQLSERLLAAGFLVTAINFPTVPRGTERLRVTVTPAHTEADIDAFISTLDSLWTEMGLQRVQDVA